MPEETLGRTLDADALAAILNDVNRIRVALAIGEGTLEELPHGIPRDADECVLARALSNGWSAYVDGAVFFVPPSEQTDLKAARRSLERDGFGVRMGGMEELDEYDVAPPEGATDVEELAFWEREILVVAMTSLFSTLVREFDAGLLPELILTDD